MMPAAMSGATMRPMRIFGIVNVFAFFCLRRLACLRAMSSHLRNSAAVCSRHAGFENPPAQFFEVDTVALCRHRHETVARHAWYRIDLQYQRLLVRARHEVDTCPARATEFVKRGDCEFRVYSLFFAGFRTGADV